MESGKFHRRVSVPSSKILMDYILAKGTDRPSSHFITIT